ncbi:MAG: hypothetical protein V3W44_09940 [Dehalococcoidales bacterium]
MSEFDKFIFITPERAVEVGAIDPCPGLEAYKRMARSKARCEVCEQPVWKLADTGLCFTCTTGEAEADEDYELI